MIEFILALQYIVRLDEKASVDAFTNDVSRQFGVKVVKRIRNFPAIVVDADSNTVKKLRKDRRVRYIQRNQIYRTVYIPNDPYFTREQWGPFVVFLNRAWDITRGDRTITIAIIDEGVDYNHAELINQFGTYKGYDFVDNDPDPAPDDPDNELHGTHVAGIIAATMNNSIGLAGAGNFTLVAYRAMDETGSGTTDDIFEAMLEAARNPDVRIVNMSLGASSGDSLMKEGIDTLLARGKIVVAAAGNNGGAVNYPAAYDGVIAVAAWDTSNTIADFSSRGLEVDVAAPGVWIISTVPNNYLAWMSGTSMAAPLVSGIVGLMLTVNPDLTPQEVTDILCATAIDVLDAGRDIYTGCGLVNAEAAVRAAQGR